jgi:hypothetical protein
MFKQFPRIKIKFYDCEYFIVVLNGKKCLFDYSDYFDCVGYDYKNFDYVFKFHLHAGVEYPANILPFPPISFYDWGKYLNSNLSYQLNKTGISMRQRSYGNSVARRDKVRSLLIKEYGSEIKWRILDKDLYFLDVEDISLAVFVPGADTNMLDRAQFQYMAYGVPTISPMLPERLTEGNFEAGVDYLMCSNDYGDLVEMINGAKKHPEFLFSMGNSAMLKFLDTSTPKAIYFKFKKLFGE